MPAFSDITSWLARATVTANLWRSLIYSAVSIVLPRIHFHSRKWKTKFSRKLYPDQNLEERRNKKCLFLTMTERTTSGQNNLVGTRTEEIIIVTKNPQQRISVFASWTITLPNLWKNMTECFARNAICGITKYALVRKARGSSFTVDDTDQNCTTNRSKFYWRKFSLDQL